MLDQINSFDTVDLIDISIWWYLIGKHWKLVQIYLYHIPIFMNKIKESKETICRLDSVLRP